MNAPIILPDKKLIGIPEPKKSEKTKKDEVENFFMMPGDELIKTIGDDPYFPKAYNFRIAIVLPILEDTNPSGNVMYSLSAMEMAYNGNNIGRVVSIGGTVGGSNNSYSDCRDLKIGDYIHYNPHAGYPYYYNHSRFLVVDDQSVIQKVYSPERHTDGIFSTYKVRGLAQ